MDRRTVEIIVVALIAVAVVSIAASTLDSTTETSDGTGLGGTNGSGSSILPGLSPNTSASIGGPNPPGWLLSLISVIGIISALWYMWNEPLETLRILVLMTVIFVGLVWLARVLSNVLGEAGGDSGGGLLGDGIGIRSDGATSASDPTLPAASVELLVLVVLGIALVGVVLRLSENPASRDAVEEPGEASEGGEPGSIGRAAGEAADRIDADAAVDNEIYRAWVEMTDLLDVEHPDTSTPEDFADAAVDAGMRPADVEELTDLFRTVRYGPEGATPGREQRAVEALRRIESTYAPEES
ncbi:MAG: DUF4129 domain-containing protein [Halobacteriales archaeon]